MKETEDTSEILCACCDTALEPDYSYKVSYCDDMVCSDCVRTCERCDSVGCENDSFSVIDGRELWCESCTDYYAQWCDSCEEYGRDSTNYIADREASWCQSCTDYSATYCDNCNEYTESGCDECNNSRVVHDYAYRPDPIFHATDGDSRLFFGLEVEVEAMRRYGDASEYAYQLEALELAYLKHDGSLNCGFEVVTHPMTHDFYKNEATELFNVLEGLRTEYKVKSWDTSTCGVHIHISRTGFNGGAHMHRFLNLVYSNPEFYQTLAGRSSDRWAKFDDVLTYNHTRDENGYWQRGPEFRSFANKLNQSKHSDRYSAVNTQNRETLEMRIFRGTVNGATIKSYLDLAHASVEYTRVMSVKEVRDGALGAIPFILYIKSHADLYPELNERMARLVPYSVRLNEQEVSA